MVAYVIDGIVVNVAVFAAAFVIALGAIGSARRDEEAGISTSAGLLMMGLVILGPWLYHALLESSSWQATLGKRAIGAVVVTTEGGRLTFGRATGRFWGKILSALTFLVGFFMIGWTERKQGLHDMLADADKPESNGGPPPRPQF